ncbi:MAG: hypothetical protein PHG65_09685, partial [Kiritimatiellae bacterium]|nr:hypothetical protein [Kiritimatiellia bacterium]
IAVLFFGALVQSVLPPLRILGFASWPVLSSLAVYFGLARQRVEALCAAFLAGLLQDSLSFIPLGFSSLSYCVAVWIVFRFRNEVFIRAWVTHLIFGALANFGVILALAIMLIGMGFVRLPWTLLVWKLAGGLVLGAVTVSVVYPMADHLYSFLGLEYQDQKA